MYKNRTNIALFGIAGGSHDGATLTDSIMVVSIDFTKKDVLFVSIPRDIYLESLKDKINSAYAYGEAQKKGSGLLLAKTSVEEIIGQPVYYAVLINFSGFKKLIDFVNGIDIHVETAFEDKEYPIEGKENDTCHGDSTFACRYETVTFEKGMQHMNGTTALKYVRSRHAIGDEGTDFARSKRQQEVLSALKEKLLHSISILNPFQLQKFLKMVDDMSDTDMKWGDIISFTKMYILNAKEIPFRYAILDWGNPEKGLPGFLINPATSDYKDMWVLIPRKKNFTEIHEYIKCETESVHCQMRP